MSAQQAVQRPWHVDLDRPPRRPQVDQIVVLMVITWRAVVLPRFVQSLTAPKHAALVNDAIPYSSTTALLSHLLTLAVIGWCVVVVALRLGDLPTDRRRVLVILLAPWIYLITRDLYAGVHLHLQDLEYPAIIIAVWVLRPPLRKLVVLGYLAAVLAVISVLMGTFLTSKGIYHARNGDLVPVDKKILPVGNPGRTVDLRKQPRPGARARPAVDRPRAKSHASSSPSSCSRPMPSSGRRPARRSRRWRSAVSIALALQVPGRKLRQVRCGRAAAGRGSRHDRDPGVDVRRHGVQQSRLHLDHQPARVVAAPCFRTRQPVVLVAGEVRRRPWSARHFTGTTRSCRWS